MEIIHVSAECYPVAKAGGLGDVVGALPKYQAHLGHITKVVMPMYRTKFLYENEFELVHEGNTWLADNRFRYSVIREKTGKLGFELYLIDINGLLDREKVYGYDDDTERFVSFQIAFLDWLIQWQHRPDVIHCHDHHTGLIPFMLKFCYGFQPLSNIRTVFTIHNGQYQGWMDWNKRSYLPHFDEWKSGMLEWADKINPLASAVKCADRVTTVSPSYMEELRFSANGLEGLFEYERGKCIGILNGIDNEVWDPKKDPLLTANFTVRTVTKGKKANKESICKEFNLDPELPLFIFIGRLVGEKAAEILPQVISESIAIHQAKLNFIVLGSGHTALEKELLQLEASVGKNFSCYIGYNETLAHRLYAAADFLLMPSLVEPCGLNQMYALRYGTVPMVRNTGGLRDTVIDIADEVRKGYGLIFTHATAWDVNAAINRAVGWYFEQPGILDGARKRMMAIDNSWENSAKHYISIYQ
jgi:starch synthase